MAARYYVEYTTRSQHGHVIDEFTLRKAGDGDLVRGKDPVLLHHIADLLNADLNQRESACSPSD